MDTLIQLAIELASQKKAPYFPIKQRLAYVVNHGQSYASDGYAIRTQTIAKALNQQNIETLCFVRPGQPWESDDSLDYAYKVAVDGVSYFHSPWITATPDNEQQHLKASVERFVELFTIYRPAYVLAASDYQVGLPAWVAAMQLGLPFFNEVRGFWELSKDARQPGFANSAQGQQEMERNTFVAQQANQVFTLNQLMANELATRGIDANKLTIIANGVNQLPTLRPACTELKAALGINANEKVIGYIGSINHYEGLDTLLEACQQLVDQGEKIKLLLVGDSPSANSVISSAQPWLIQMGRVPHDMVADYYALIDAIVIPRKKLPVCELVPPIKVVEALAYAKPLVVSNVAALAEYADKYESVLSFDAGNTKDLASALQRSLKLPVLQPSDELRFSKHSEAMVKILVSEKGTFNQNVMPESLGKLITRIKPTLSTPIKPLEAVNAAYDQADETFYIAPKLLTLHGHSKQLILNKIDVPISGSILELSASVVYQLKSAATTRKAVLLFDFFNKQEEKISSIPNIGIAAAFKQHFRYLNANSKTTDDKLQEVFKFKLPVEVASVSLSVGTLGIKDNEKVELRIEGRCYSEDAEKERKRQKLQRQPLPEALVYDPSQKRYTSDLVVACVLDEFTAECLSHEVKLIKVTQENWQSQIELDRPDFLLVESCWKGNDGNWGTLTKGSSGGKKLSGLLRYCQQQGIPTVFWNKEDPPHYDKFGPIAKLFDLAITTDVNMVPRYKADFGIDVYPLSFGAQPKVHNPQQDILRLPKAVFAGSYYGDKPKRCEDFNEVMGQLELAHVGYDIFDRNFKQGIEKFFFPDKYQDRIVGNLPPEEVWKAHKGYKYQVNMNSVQDSATMFARRVYESLASGTPVISNDSVGVRELFGDIVIMSGEKSIAEQLKELENSPEAYHALARRGVRAVMREHTYGHRIQSLCRFLDINVEVKQPKVTLAVIACNEADIEKAKQVFDAQTAQNKHLFIELENFETAYQFLNSSNDSVTYAMRLSREFYTEDSDFYGCDKVLKYDLSLPLDNEALEDFLYWGEGEFSAKGNNLNEVFA